MSRKLVVLGILFGLGSLLVFRWSELSLPANAENVAGNPTYSEQHGYEQFVKKIPLQTWNQINWNPPFYLLNGGLPRVIHDCGTYIAVNQLLVKEAFKEEPVEEPEPQPQEERKQIALTFDDGPNDKSTVQILAILKKYDVKATFFVLGQNVVKHLDVVRMIHDQGHEVANHSWSHKNLTKLNPAQMHDEIDRTSDAIFEATGEYPASYRPPYGAIDASVRKEIQLNSVLWNIDTMDWHHKDPVKTLKNVKANAKDGGIILMHDIHQQSADALEAILQYLQQEDYEFVTTKELGK
ncbi:MAG: polysaccharide deacetylase family protein [Solibacillus sp.]|uniref:polysaccharide deacetylase family protein n=1 Tax=unclassified Solibacillus TaxID=2637870 RepID=UPI003101930D